MPIVGGVLAALKMELLRNAMVCVAMQLSVVLPGVPPLLLPLSGVTPTPTS